jgi:hypothetical protein
MAITQRDLPAGTVLVGKHRGQPHRVLVLADAEGKLGFELDGGTIYRSLSAAASAAMGGMSANGWRFFSIEGEEGKVAAEDQGRPEPPRTAKQAKTKQIRRVPNQQNIPEGQVKWFCSACQKSFLMPEDAEPEVCPAGHPREVADELGAPEPSAEA